MAFKRGDHAPRPRGPRPPPSSRNNDGHRRQQSLLLLPLPYLSGVPRKDTNQSTPFSSIWRASAVIVVATAFLWGIRTNLRVDDDDTGDHDGKAAGLACSENEVLFPGLLESNQIQLFPNLFLLAQIKVTITRVELSPTYSWFSTQFPYWEVCLASFLPFQVLVSAPEMIMSGDVPSV